MLRIRLARFGTKKRPTYRLGVFERARDNAGAAIEYVGHYNPRTNPKTISLEAEKIKEWMGKGAQPTPTVHNLLIDAGVLTGKKARAFGIKKKEEDKKAEAPKPASPAEIPAKEVKPEEKPAEKLAEAPAEESKPVSKPAEEVEK